MFENTINLYKSNIIAIYKYGSSEIPFLKEKAKDIDYVIIVNTKDDNLFNDIKLELKKESLDEKNNYIVEELKDSVTPIYVWTNYYAKKLYGNQNTYIENIKLLEHKQEYIEAQRNEVYYHLKSKTLYHLVASMYVIQNNSYNFTQSQIDDIISAYDKNASDELKNKIINFYGAKESINNILNKIAKNKSKLMLIQETRKKINLNKRLLANSDYRAIKFAEGEYTVEEYAPYKAQREAWRKEINELEAELEKI